MIAKIKRIALSLAIIFTPLLGVSAAFPTAAYAQPAGNTGGGDGCASNSFFPTWYDGLCKDGNIKSPNEMSGSDTAGKLGKWITVIAMNLVTILLTVVGYVSLGFIIYGGFKYMTSGDSSSGTQAARKTLTNAVIGLVLSIMSVAIVKFVAGAIA